jgi:hypothetical protein
MRLFYRHFYRNVEPLLFHYIATNVARCYSLQNVDKTVAKIVTLKFYKLLFHPY